MKMRLAIAGFSALIASVLPDILFSTFLHSVPEWLVWVKLAVLVCALPACLLLKELRPVSKFLAVLAVAVLMQIICALIAASRFWKELFNQATFIGNTGGNILLKAIGILPILLLLRLLFKSRRDFFLCKGDLAAKAARIGWLGIKENTIGWGKLSVISAALIALGTITFTVLTATNLSGFNGVSRFLRYLPVILPFAAANSFCEGFLYRNAVLGTLKPILPKQHAVLLAGVFFGIPHFYGMPSGVAGAVVSSVLGWFMCRSLYETNGFVSSWIIHFAQDTVIFSILCLMGNLV